MSQDSEEIQESLRACEELSKYLTDEELDDVPLDEIYQIAYENSKKKDASKEMPEPMCSRMKKKISPLIIRRQLRLGKVRR